MNIFELFKNCFGLKIIKNKQSIKSTPSYNSNLDSLTNLDPIINLNSITELVVGKKQLNPNTKFLNILFICDAPPHPSNKPGHHWKGYTVIDGYWIDDTK